MKVEVWTDIVCPWCGIGQHRLNQALAAFASESSTPVEVLHRSFQLDPDAGPPRPVRELLRKKYRVDEAQLTEMGRRVEAVAAADGLTPYVTLDNVGGNTSLIHQMLHMANEAGFSATAWDYVSHAYFAEQRDIFTETSVIQIGVEIGLDKSALTTALQTKRFLKQVVADQTAAQALGATGVPFFVIDGRIGVAGAQATTTLLRALREAASGVPAR